jgi:two-component system sensor histidine kinase and response regulator WspE
MSQPPSNFGDLSMLELFRVEAENQAAALSAGLLELEQNPARAAEQLKTLMRAAHSLKGAAQIVRLPVVSRLAHAMEDTFVAAQRGRLVLGQNEADVLLRGVDWFVHISKTPEAQLAVWETDHAGAVEGYLADLAALAGKPAPAGSVPAPPSETAKAVEKPMSAAVGEPASGMLLRLTPETVNRLLGLAGESLVESRRLQPLAVSMQRLKRLHAELSTTLDGLRDTLAGQPLPERAAAQLAEMSRRAADCREFLAGRIEELDAFDRRTARISHRLYRETLQVRMRPFGDGVSRFPRMVRDLARSLGREVRLEITGENTQVDRDLLEKLDAPLTHLLRNALDHGCEPPEERRRQAKPPEGVVRLEARHSAGSLLVSVADDGRGIDPEQLREAVVRKKLVSAAVAEKLSESELLEFLFLPGFSLKEQVTEMSGRGVGLDLVREMVKAVRGKIQVTAQPGRGTRFQLQLPISLSVIRALLVEVVEEPYAVPLAQIVHTFKLPESRVQSVGGCPTFTYENRPVKLVAARQVFHRGGAPLEGDELSVVVLGGRGSHHGLVVDRFLGERELVVQPLDARLGKVRDVTAAAVMEDGSPVLILDVESLVRSIEKNLSAALHDHPAAETARRLVRGPRRILVVDDSLTVRELHRKLLTGQGYSVEVAVDGMDGWDVVRAGEFDLVITDVDMPRMDGLELVSLIKNDARLRRLPVVMLSHKERDEDRRRGIAAGANEYLTKSGFQEEKLIQVIRNLTGD